MSLYQVKGFGVWYVSITHNGQRVRHSTGTSDRRAAQEYHDKLKADLWRAAALGERKKVEHTWAEAAEVWMRAAARSQSDAYRLRWISERWRVMKLADIDADAVDALVLSRARIPSDFWDYDDIAYHLRASKSTVTRWASLPDFPRPIRPPTAGRGLGHPLPVPPNAKVSGAGTASAGLPGWQANGETE